MYNLVITGVVASIGWNPYGKPGPADPDIGVTGKPISPSYWPYAQPVATQPRPEPQVARATPRPVTTSSATVDKATEPKSGYPAIPDPSEGPVSDQPKTTGKTEMPTNVPIVTVPDPTN